MLSHTFLSMCMAYICLLIVWVHWYVLMYIIIIPVGLILYKLEGVDKNRTNFFKVPCIQLLSKIHMNYQNISKQSIWLTVQLWISRLFKCYYRFTSSVFVFITLHPKVVHMICIYRDVEIVEREARLVSTNIRTIRINGLRIDNI